MNFSFTIRHTDGRARSGSLVTPHGVIETPAFVPVGTQATVKALTPRDLQKTKTQIVMSNTYHLYLRPGGDTLEKLGGLHEFMKWEGPLMTDSGGFQVLSLGAGIEHGVGKIIDLFARSDGSRRADDSKVESVIRAKKADGQMVLREKFCVVTDERIIFKSHLDGTFHEWTPEKSIAVQKQLGADIMFALDECTSPMHDRQYTEKSLRRSHSWEERSLAAFAGPVTRCTPDQYARKARILPGAPLVPPAANSQALYGIIQGGPYEDLRRTSAKFVEQKKFFGVGIGGALINKSTMKQILGWISDELIGEKPTHLLGIGGIDDIFDGVEHGVDTFDCADPTRVARRGDLLMLPQDGGTYRNRWRMHITSAQFHDDPDPMSDHCGCELCQSRYSRGYINHLFWANELLVFRLATIHNIFVMNLLMNDIREGIETKTLEKVRKRWIG